MASVASAVALTSRLVRVTFGQNMAKNNLLTDPNNYMITEGLNAAPVYVQSVRSDPDATPEYVDLITSEMTNGADYTAEVNPGDGGPVDTEGDNIGELNSAAFVGKGDAPTITQVQAIGTNRVDVKFSESMLGNADIRDASRYSFNNGLTVLEVLQVSGDTVKLLTSDQTPGTLYTLTINNVPSDHFLSQDGRMFIAQNGAIFVQQ